MKKKLFMLFMVLGLLISFSSPMLAFAETPPGGGNGGCTGYGGGATGGTLTGTSWDFRAVICRIESILGALVPLMIGLGMVYFIYGVITYVIAGDDEAKTKGRDAMIYGIIGLAAIICVWGLVAIFANTFGLNQNVQVKFPSIQTN